MGAANPDLEELGGLMTNPLHELRALWAMWGILLAAIAVTYSRLDPDELYHVTRPGLVGGASRVLVEINYPLALFAIATALIAVDALSVRWWWLAGPTTAACALVAWPGVVDNNDLDARAINVVPAIGVAGALVLSLAAIRGAGSSPVTSRHFDRARVVLTASVAFLSLPWILADLGMYLPEVGFISERPITGSDGRINPAVHLGDHHGFNGALLLISALWLSRIQLGASRLRTTTTAYVALMAAYGSVNFIQDLTNEQLYKRDLVSWRIPDALKPEPTIVWLVIIAITLACYPLIAHGRRPKSALEEAP
jgi:hypothetical protein